MAKSDVYPIVIRSGWGTWIPGIVWVVVGAGTIDILIRGTQADKVGYIPWLAVICWGVWWLMWRPRIIVGRREVVVRDVMRTFSIPYGRLRDIREGAYLTLYYEDASGRERHISPWATPSLKRPRPSAAQLSRAQDDMHRAGGKRPKSIFPQPDPAHTDPLRPLRDAWQQCEDAETDVSVRTSIVPLLVGLGLVAVALLLPLVNLR